MTESDQGAARRGFGKVAERVSAMASGEQPAPGRVKSAAQREVRPAKAEPSPGPRTSRPSVARPATTVTTTGATAPAGQRRNPRKARLRLTQVDAWSVMKTAFLLSIAIGIVTIVAVGIVWSVLGAAGVWDSLNNTVQTVMGNDFRTQDYIGTGRVLGFTMLVSAVDVVLLTAIATLGAFLYNLSATLLGGIEVTFTEDN